MRPFIALLLMAILLAPLAAHPGAAAPVAAQATPPELSQTIDQLDGRIERESIGGSGNDSPPASELIGPTLSQRDIVSWAQTVSGTIASSSDVDYFRFVVPSPASRVRITLSGLPANYDLVFGGGSQQDGDGKPLLDASFDPGQPGLEGITQVGSSINSIGSSINSIGSSINSIGSSINSIGSSINSIGSSINSISANSGTTPEQINSFLWQPGVYFVAVTSSNGQFSERPYRLEVTLEGSALAAPLPAPEVEVRLSTPSYVNDPNEITTLYIYHPERIEQLYGSAGATQVFSITNALGWLTGSVGDPPNPPQPANLPPEYGLVLNLAELQPTLGNTRTISEVYALWDSNRTNPLYANFVARLIDNLIRSATQPTPGPSGPSPAFQLGNASAEAVTFPNVRNIVLIGGDAVIPFFRMPDLTTIANEADYLDYTHSIFGSNMIDPNSAQGAALRYRMLLSDNPYGTDRPYRFYGAPLFLPRLAVGRIVENPEDIARYLNAYANGSISDFQVDATAFGQPDGPARAFASGYDFLRDQAGAITTIFTRTGLLLGNSGNPSNDINLLNNDTWTSNDVEREWFDNRLPAPGSLVQSSNLQVGLSSVNAHFDHWQLLPASSTAGNFPALRLQGLQYDPQQSFLRESFFLSTLGYSVGCHSGYNMIDAAIVLPRTRLINPVDYQADFAQALNRHGGSWIGNTGYGYGTADGIDYSERLAVLLTEEMARETQGSDGARAYPSIGEALMLAKQRYVRNATSLSAYDYKVLSIMTLYGLPFKRVVVTTPLAPPSEDPAPDGGAPLQTPAPREASLTTGQLTRTISFTINIDAASFTESGRTGTLLRLSPELFTQIEDDFIGPSLSSGLNPRDLLRIFENNQVGAPALPSFAYDISALNQVGTQRLKVRDVVFVGGTYAERPGFDPQITQVVTETNTPIISTTLEPDFLAGAGIWFPDKFYGYSTVGEDELQRDQLTSVAAQLRANSDGSTGLLRPYSRMVFRVTYDDLSIENETTALLRADDRPPGIESVKIIDATGSTALAASESNSLLVVRASDEDAQGKPQPSAGLTVAALFIQGGVNWIELPLKLNPTTGVFTASLPAAASAARYIVRATDPSSNTTYFTAGGRFTAFSRSSLYMPLVRR